MLLYYNSKKSALPIAEHQKDFISNTIVFMFCFSFQEKNEYEFYLQENSPAETVIGRVSAYDLDLGRNAEITYKFTIENDHFEIDKQSGFISSKIVVDRENMATSSEFDIEVIASDQGLVAQTAVAKVLISILDENDNKPVFSQDTYQAVISEGNLFWTL